LECLSVIAAVVNIIDISKNACTFKALVSKLEIISPNDAKHIAKLLKWRKFLYLCETLTISVNNSQNNMVKKESLKFIKIKCR
jgi:hypothetical protein